MHGIVLSAASHMEDLATAGKAGNWVWSTIFDVDGVKFRVLPSSDIMTCSRPAKDAEYVVGRLTEVSICRSRG